MIAMEAAAYLYYQMQCNTRLLRKGRSKSKEDCTTQRCEFLVGRTGVQSGNLQMKYRLILTE